MNRRSFTGIDLNPAPDPQACLARNIHTVQASKALIPKSLFWNSPQREPRGIRIMLKCQSAVA